MLRVYLDGRLRILTRLDRLVEAIVLGFGFVAITIWGFQAVCIALREIARMGGIW